MRQRLKRASIHIEVWTAGPLMTDRGALTPDPPPPSLPESVDRPRGLAEEDEKIF